MRALADEVTVRKSHLISLCSYHCFSAGRIRSQDHGMWPLVNSWRISGTVCAEGFPHTLSICKCTHLNQYLYIYLSINIITFLGELQHMTFYWLNSHCLVIKTSNYVKRWEIIESETTHEDLWCTRNISCFIYFTLHVGCTTWLRFGWTKFFIYMYIYMQWHIFVKIFCNVLVNI